MEQIGSDGFDALHLDWLAVLWQQWLHGLSGHQLGWVPCQLVVVEVTVDNLVDDWILVWLLEQWPVLESGLLAVQVDKLPVPLVW